MTDIEKKALALVNEVRAECQARRQDRVGERPMTDDLVKRLRVPCFEIGLDEGWIDAQRAEAADRIEQHEAFRQEVSDAAMEYDKHYSPMGWTGFKCFIIAKPDPLAEAMTEAISDSGAWEPCNTADADALREALAKRGGKIVWENGK